MKNTNILPTINNLLSEEEISKVTIEARISSRRALDGEYISIAEELQAEYYNQTALNHLRAII